MYIKNTLMWQSGKVALWQNVFSKTVQLFVRSIVRNKEC